jgi:hypothetical protein
MPQSSWGSGWYPTEEWPPIKAPPYDRKPNEWQKIGSPPPPPGTIIHWWLDPNNPRVNSDKSTWPYQPVPWGFKALGTFSPRKIKMREDIGAPVNDGPSKPWPPSNIWPTVKYPQPAGLAHVNTRPDGVWGVTKSVHTIKVRMLPDVWLDISPHPSVWAQGKFEVALQEMSRKRPLTLQTEDGSSITIRSIRHPNWGRKVREARQYRAAMKARREQEHQEMMAEEIAKNDARTKPTTDLFV